MSSTSSDDEEYKELMLKKLNAYADDLLGYSDTPKNKKSEKISTTTSTNKVDTIKPIDVSISKRKRRKQNKFLNKRIEEKKSHLAKICDIVGIEDITKQIKKNDNDRVILNNDMNHLQELNSKSKVQVFLDPDAERKKKRDLKKAQKLITLSESNESKDVVVEKEFDLKKAALDVRRCGIKAMDNSLKEHATISMLTDLGAKAPKKQYTNYRQLQINLQEKNKQIAKDKEQENLLGIKKTKKQKKKRKRNEINHLDGQIGVYKRGVQMIGNKAIKKSQKY